MKSYLKQVSYSLIAWVFLTLFDTFRVMSTIVGSGEKMSLLGVKVSIVEAAELSMDFALTSQYAWETVIFIVLWLIVYSLYRVFENTRTPKTKDD